MASSASKKQKTYHFNTEWEQLYFFTEFKGKNICLLCNATVSVAKKGNIERHHKTMHSTFEKMYPINSSIRSEKLKLVKNQLTGQQSTMLRTVDRCKTATEASFRVAQIIAQKKKAYEDGEMIKQAFLEAADSLFDNFQNKREIMNSIKSLQLSANTVMRRVEAMSSDIVLQLKKDLDNCVYFSLQLDESIDIADVAQLAVFVRMVFSNFEIKEELMKIIPLKGHTTGQDLYSHLKSLIISENIPIRKMAALTTDGAPAMVGSEKGLVALCRKDENFPLFISYHCIIHQQALCGKFLKCNEVMQLVVKIVNKVRAHSLQRRLFKALTDEMNCQYGDLVLHCDVRWLSRGSVLKRFHEVLPALIEFFKDRGETITELEDEVWLQELGFLTDITDKLNELNLQLQGRDKELHDMISNVQAFAKKLEFWENNLKNGNTKHFVYLSKKIDENITKKYYNRNSHVEILSHLQKAFNERFADFGRIAIIAQFVASPLSSIDIEQVSSVMNQMLGENTTQIEMEIIALQCDLTLKSTTDAKCIWPFVCKDKYPSLVSVALKIKAMFSSTYLCESSFSNMKLIKNKYRSRLTDEHLDNCLRMSVTSYSPNLKKLVEDNQCQTSH